MDKKQYIINEIKRIAQESGGKAPGKQRFQRETGIKESDWYPNLWLRWGDALLEAGLSPNKMRAAYSDNELIEKYAMFIRELGRFPLSGEVRLKSKEDPSFPSHNVFNRFGMKNVFASRIIDFCRSQNGWDDVIELCIEIANSRTHSSKETVELGPGVPMGFVYLIKSGKYYKIGQSKSPGRREYDLAIRLPDPPKMIHKIKTDDPSGIEAYWHKRFKDRRKGGEWFDLTADDIKAFKRRKFM